MRLQLFVHVWMGVSLSRLLKFGEAFARTRCTAPVFFFLLGPPFGCCVCVCCVNFPVLAACCAPPAIKGMTFHTPALTATHASTAHNGNGIRQVVGGQSALHQLMLNDARARACAHHGFMHLCVCLIYNTCHGQTRRVPRIVNNINVRALTHTHTQLPPVCGGVCWGRWRECAASSGRWSGPNMRAGAHTHNRARHTPNSSRNDLHFCT